MQAGGGRGGAGQVHQTLTRDGAAAARLAHNQKVGGSSPPRATINRLSKIDVAYIAGLFDGEGDVGVYRYVHSKNGVAYLRVLMRITNTHLGVLEWVRDKVGAGTVLTRHDKRRSAFRSPCFRYQVAHSNAKALLIAMRPYLKIKASKVDKILREPHIGRAEARDSDR